MKKLFIDTGAWIALNNSRDIHHVDAVKANKDFLDKGYFYVSTDYVEAWEIFKKYFDKDFSFTDCTSFAVMKIRKISEVFSFDKHFEQYGFKRLPDLSKQ